MISSLSNPNITSSKTMNLLIPHLAVGQTIQEWKGMFVASTVTLTVTQKLEILPNFVNRYPGEQELAKIAAKKTTVAAAFKELAKLVDGKTDDISDFKDFMDTRLGCSEIAAQKAMLFDLVRKGTEAAIPTDIICKKFFAEIPGGAKLYESNKDKVKTGMVETDFVTLMQAVQDKMKKTELPKAAIKEEIFLGDQGSSQQIPSWANEMFSEIRAIKRAMVVPSEDDESYTSQTSEILEASLADKEKKCQICNKKNHSADTCWLRICKFCSGKGHDLEECASLANKNKSKKRAASKRS